MHFVIAVNAFPSVSKSTWESTVMRVRGGVDREKSFESLLPLEDKVMEHNIQVF